MKRSKSRQIFYGRFKCPECPRSYLSKKHLNAHKRTHSPNNPYACTVCNHQFESNTGLNRHLERADAQGQFKCHLCLVTLTTKHEKTIHLRTHGNSGMNCTQCNKQFRSKTGFALHSQKYHAGENRKSESPNQPQHDEVESEEENDEDESDEILETSSAINEVVEDSSDNPKPNMSIISEPDSDQVDRDTNGNADQVKHLIHKCPLCDFKSRRNYNLTAHMKRKHCMTKVYNCSFCSSDFETYIDLKRHERKHGQKKFNKCRYCGKYFQSGAGLQNHENIHTGTKNHKCEICGAAFVQKPNLIRHVKFCITLL